jgi:hypothetical protein
MSPELKAVGKMDLCHLFPMNIKDCTLIFTITAIQLAKLSNNCYFLSFKFWIPEESWGSAYNRTKLLSTLADKITK